MKKLTGIVESKGCGPFWSYSYGRDTAGQLSSSSDPRDGGQHTYGYDVLNRLASRSQTGGTSSGGGLAWPSPGGRSRGNI